LVSKRLNVKGPFPARRCDNCRFRDIGCRTCDCCSSSLWRDSSGLAPRRPLSSTRCSKRASSASLRATVRPLTRSVPKVQRVPNTILCGPSPRNWESRWSSSQSTASPR